MLKRFLNIAIWLPAVLIFAASFIIFLLMYPLYYIWTGKSTDSYFYGIEGTLFDKVMDKMASILEFKL